MNNKSHVHHLWCTTNRPYHKIHYNWRYIGPPSYYVIILQTTFEKTVQSVCNDVSKVKIRLVKEGHKQNVCTKDTFSDVPEQLDVHEQSDKEAKKKKWSKWSKWSR